MSDAKTELDALQKGILDALNGGEAVSTTPAAPDSGMQLAYQKKLLDCAKKMNAFYQYLNGDAESVQKKKKPSWKKSQTALLLQRTWLPDWIPLMPGRFYRGLPPI